MRRTLTSDTTVLLASLLLLITTIDHVTCKHVISYDMLVTANSSSTFSNWEPSRVIDRSTRTDADYCGCCSATNNQLNPWYQIDLGQQRVVTGIKIDGRGHPQHGQHFRNLEVYLKSVHDGFTDPVAREADAVYQVDFMLPEPKSTRYVSLVLKDQQRVFTICELMIYGECLEGQFGYYCHFQCHCEGEPCNTTSGVCPSGTCLAGYQGEKCDAPCQSGTYGPGCTKTCGECYQNAACDITTGKCPGKCQRGYRGDWCKKECKEGTYGQDCKFPCGNCTDNEPCNTVTGVCVNGCTDGYRTQYCDLKCGTGTYGKDCKDRCGNCKTGENCIFTNGTCPNGCQAGFQGDICKTECSDGFFGEDCRYTCGRCINREPCNRRTGYCSAGCEPGYIGDYCNQTCDAGHYGDGCLEDCGNCESDSICNYTNGICSSGCESGYKPPMCSDECEDGKFGQNCNSDCGHCINNTACNKQNGTCSSCQPGYGGHVCIVVLLQQTGGNTDESGSMSAMVGGLIGGVLALLLIVIVVVVITKRRSATKETPRVHRSIDNLNDQGHTKEGRDINTMPVTVVSVDKEVVKPVRKASNITPDEHDYYGFISRKKELKVCQLWDYIHQKKKDGCVMFFQEFNEIIRMSTDNIDEKHPAFRKLLKAGLIHPHETALLTVNKTKNRYRGLCAYDHSRVPLKAEEEGESEYINASFINGTEKMKKFIASQGPTEAMRTDFWRMVWQLNCAQIVMLTNLFEMGTEKCLLYWPETDQEDVTYGKITVNLKSELNQPDYVIRRLKVRQHTGDWRDVTQYHFRSWPDKDVPDSTWSLVNFWMLVMNESRDSHGPIVAHCSAGIGRTGTFIALDNAYNQAKREGAIRILDIVTALREQRVNMVQTKEQYTFLHEAVADALLFGTHYIWSSQFEHIYQHLTEEVKGEKCHRLKTQYKLIVDSIEDRKNILIDNHEDNDVEYSNVFIHQHTSTVSHNHEEFLPRSKDKSQALELGAVFLPNYKEENAFIVSKSPSDTTVDTYWSLIVENNVKTIISVQNTTSVDKYWTSYEPVKSNYKVTLTEGNQSSFYKELIISITTKDTPTTIHMFEFINWEVKNAIPNDTRSMVDFLEVVQDRQQRLTPEQPVLVYCSNGYEKSGLVCVVLNELERMKRDEGHINIVETVKLMKERNENIIPNFMVWMDLMVIMNTQCLEMSKFNKDDQLAGKTCAVSDRVVNKPVKSVIQCAALSNIYSQSVSFVFDVTDHICHGCNRNLQTSDVTLIDTDSQTKYFVKDNLLTLTCADIISEQPEVTSGRFVNKIGMDIYCDMETDGGGWTVFQRRFDGSVNFDRTYDEYKHGFGNINGGEFWLGLENVHRLLETSGKKFQLRIDLADTRNDTTYALYHYFDLGGDSENYTIHGGNYSGTAGDSLFSGRDLNGVMFSTKDADNDRYGCPVMWSCGWWFLSCTQAMLNGPFKPDYFFWDTWNWTKNITLAKASMKIKEF